MISKCNRGLAAAVLVAATFTCGSAVLAESHAKMKHDGGMVKVGDVVVSGAWARQSLRKGGNSAAFMMVKNAGHSDDVLVSAASDVAKRVELHNHVNDNGVMKMRQVKTGIPVKAGAMAELKPGGYHVMLIGLKRDLKPGDKVHLTLTFKSGASAKLMVPVRDLKGGHMKHMKHNQN